MAQLYQLINTIPGLQGKSAFEKQQDLYKRLGGQGVYTGDINQNTWLLNNINSGKATSALAAPAPVTAQAVAPSSPYDILKQTALDNQLLKSEVAFEDINPFSKYFNEDLFRQSVAQGIKPEVDRITGNLNAGDQSYRQTEQRAFQNNVNTLNQNASNTGSFYGGARIAKQNRLADTRNQGLADYSRSFNDQMLNTKRQFDRTIEDQVAAEKLKKTQGYNEEKGTYYKNATYK